MAGMDPLPEPELHDVESQSTAVIPGVVPLAELADFYDGSFQELGAVLAEQGITPVGAAFGVYHGPPSDTVDLEVGFPVAGPIRPSGRVEGRELPAGRVARTVHAGSFDRLGEAWGRLAAWIDAHDLQAGRVFWEVYLTEPSPDMDPADLRTELNWPVEPRNP
jgi:effector-binding domain-containing protein